MRRAAPSRSDSKRSRGGGAAAREGLGRLFLEVGTVPPGDYFGAVTLTRRTPQMTSAITTEPTRCYVLNKWDLIKRVDSEAVTRFQASKVRFGRFAADDAGLIAEFHRARDGDSTRVRSPGRWWRRRSEPRGRKEGSGGPRYDASHRRTTSCATTSLAGPSVAALRPAERVDQTRHTRQHVIGASHIRWRERADAWWCVGASCALRARGVASTRCSASDATRLVCERRCLARGVGEAYAPRRPPRGDRILVDASDPAKVSAAALASYAREAVVASPRGAGTRRGDRRGSARTSRGGRGGGGPHGGSAQTSGDATGRREHRLRAQPRRRREGATKRRRQGAPPRRRACRRARRIRRGGLPRGRRQLRRARDVRPRRLSTRRAQETRRVPQTHGDPLRLRRRRPRRRPPRGSQRTPSHGRRPRVGRHGPRAEIRRRDVVRRRTRRRRRRTFGTAGGCCRRSRRVRSIRGGARGGVRGSIRRRWRGRRHVRHRRPSGGFHMLSRPRAGPAKRQSQSRKIAREPSTTTTTPPPRKSDSSFCSWASANVRRPTVRPFCLRLPLRANVAAFRVTAATVRAPRRLVATTSARRSRRDGALSASAPPRTTREWKTDGWRSSPNPNRRSTSRRITSATIRVAWCTPLADFFTTACGQRRRRTVQGGRRHRRRASPPNFRAAQETIPRERRGVLRPGGGDDGASAGDNLRARHGGPRRVSDFVRGSRAGRADAVARLQAPASVGASAPRRGDILRAFTTSTLSYGPRAQLLGDLSGTKRAVVLFGADNQPWGKTISALKSGLVADGPVTLILERDRDEARASAWTPEEARATPVGETGNGGETARERVEEIGGA